VLQAGGGCAGAAAALLLRAQEKRVLERAFMLQVTREELVGSHGRRSACSSAPSCCR
jgi:2-polyprenyl-6-methoxyphenol hydroxylase-like FAD-dependent oxidoreductase